MGNAGAANGLEFGEPAVGLATALLVAAGLFAGKPLGVMAYANRDGLLPGLTFPACALVPLALVLGPAKFMTESPTLTPLARCGRDEIN